MATSVSTLAPPVTETEENVRSRTLAVEWPIYAVVFASTCILVGLLWDVSWHRTIGRDTFWSPPHIVEQVAAIVAGLSCGWLVLHTTFAGSPEERAQSVRFWRFFQAPLGAWVCIWATITMIMSAPFDDWWHNAYGLDVRIISPPHTVLASGMIGLQLGAGLMALGAQNRATDDRDRKRLGIIFAWAAGIIIGFAAIFIQEEASYGNAMHGSKFYRLTAMVFPIFLVAFARASRLKWPATTIALLYMGIVLVNMWIIESFPAQPRLAPIYNPVTHMVPPQFPLLFVFPGIAIDLLIRRFGNGRDWTLSIALGIAFVLVMIAAHWFWGDFLISPAARNWFFAADKWDYNSRLGPWRYQFWNLDRDASKNFSPMLFLRGIAIAIVYAVIGSRIGLWWGKGMALVKR